MKVEVVQFMRPTGIPVRRTANISDELELTYRRMQAVGMRYEAEVLADGMVSVAISQGDIDVEIECVPNGPDVRLAMERLLRKVFGVASEVGHGA